ncbi:MAG: AIPR family protein [Rivularia sp. T60_A2020_040]|nr:AIPR family protein [Rivularia sp. T60_A2020_040]
MLDSLYTAPARFAEKHSGITVSAHAIKFLSDTEIELEVLDYSEGYAHYGILNGGHTVLAFENASKFGYNLDNARVKVIIHIGLNQELSKDIGLATNTSSPVDTRSRMNARGGYDFIKEYIYQYKWVLPFEEFREDLIQHLWKKHFLEYLKREKAAGNSIGARLSRNNELWEDL